MESKTVYFEKREPQNTEATFQLVEDRLKGSEIKKIVLASTTGTTAKKAMEFFQNSGITLIVVPHQFGHRDRKVNPFPNELVKSLKDAGHVVHFATMLFRTGALFESNVPALMANLLRCFSQGVKVCFEIVLMVTDAGLVDRGERLIAVAGTVSGADTALVMQAASSQHLKRLRVHELICKPLNPLNIDEVYKEETFLRKPGSSEHE